MIDAVGIGLLLVGLAFQFVAAVGFIRFPDVYCRLHVVGVNDTLGAPLVLLGIGILIAPDWTAIKLLLAVLFLFLTSPLVGHLLARAAIEAGHRPWQSERDKS